MSNDFIKKNYHLITFFICYLTLLIGFFLGENITTGPKRDFLHTWDGAMEFNDDLLFSLFNFDKIENYTRISPVYLILVSLVNKIFQSFELTRLFLFFVMSLCQVFFYKILKKIYFPKITKNKKILFCLSCVIFISPSFRANVIWPESAMLGLLFFLVGIYFFAKNKIKVDQKNIFLNIFFVAIAAYIRPSYALFSVFFLIYFALQVKNLKVVLYAIVMNLFLAAPALYYIFILEINFFAISVKGGSGLNFNYLSKLPIIFSIFFFHIIPILLYKKLFYERYFFKENLNLLLITLPVSCVSIYFFNYDINLTGGGIFLHLSNFIFHNDNLFLILTPLFVFFVLKILKEDVLRNTIILALIIISIPQFTVYHKYLDPLIIILSLCLFNFKIYSNFFSIKYVSLIFIFYIMYYLACLININFLISLKV